MNEEVHEGGYTATFFSHFVDATLTSPLCTLVSMQACTAEEAAHLVEYGTRSRDELDAVFAATLVELDAAKATRFEEQLQNDNIGASAASFVAVHELRTKLRMIVVAAEAKTEGLGVGEEVNDATVWKTEGRGIEKIVAMSAEL